MSAPPADAHGDADEEELLWEGGFSPKAMFTWWVGAAVLTVVLVVGLIFFWAVPFMPIVIITLIVLAWLWPACVLMDRRFALRY